MSSPRQSQTATPRVHHLHRRRRPLATVEVWVDRQTGRLVIEVDGHHRDGVVIDVDYNGETAAVLENGVNTW